MTRRVVSSAVFVLPLVYLEISGNHLSNLDKVSALLRQEDVCRRIESIDPDGIRPMNRFNFFAFSNSYLKEIKTG